MISKPVVKKHGSKRKTYWGAPRKVKSINVVDNVENSSVPLKKKRHLGKKKQKSEQQPNQKRINILAQPKCVKHKPEHRSRSYNANESTRKIVRTPVLKNSKAFQAPYPNKKSQIKKIKRIHGAIGDFILSTATKNDRSTIVLPKKIGVRLFSLVKKRLKEINESKTV